MTRFLSAAALVLATVAPVQAAQARTMQLDFWYCFGALTCSEATGQLGTYYVDTRAHTWTSSAGDTGTWYTDQGLIWLMYDADPLTYYFGDYDPSTKCITGDMVARFNRGTWGGCLVP